MAQDWEVLPLGAVCSRVRTKNSRSRQRVFTVSAERGLVDQETFFTKRVASADLSTYWVVSPNDLVYNKSTSKDAPNGVVARHRGDTDGAVTPLYIVFRADTARVTPEFLELACNSDGFFASLQGTLREGARSHGLLNVRLEEFFAATLALPTTVEQRRIVKLIGVLDAQIARLGAEIESGNVLYATLRRSLLLGASACDTQSLGDVAEVRLGRMLSKERAAGEDQAPYIRNANVQWAGLDLTDLKRMSFPARERETYQLLAGDILVCEGGDPGRAVLLEADLPGVYYQKAIHRVRTCGVDPGFLYEYLSEAYHSGATADLCTNTTIAHLTAEKFRTLRIKFPSDAEQLRITSSLRLTRSCVASAAAEFEALRRLRGTLLSNLLSGDIEIPESYDALLEAI